MKTFKIGNDRSLKLNKKNDCISIEEKGTKKAAHFTPARWASFLLCLDQIDDHTQTVWGWRRGMLLALLRCMACIADKGFTLRWPAKILRTQGPENVEAYKDWHRSTSARVADVQAGCGEVTSWQPVCGKLYAVFPQHGPQQFTELSGVQSVYGCVLDSINKRLLSRI